MTLNIDAIIQAKPLDTCRFFFIKSSLEFDSKKLIKFLERHTIHTNNQYNIQYDTFSKYNVTYD